MTRRDFLSTGCLLAAGAGALPRFSSPLHAATPEVAVAPPHALPFQISLAEWSLHQTLEAGKLQNIDFPRYAKREFGIDTVEYVDQFFADKSRDAAYLAELKKRCDGEGVRSGLIMIDTAGDLGDADAGKRAKAVEAHTAWMDAAKSLGCHSLRVNARGEGSATEVRKRMAESCAKLAEHGKSLDVNLIIENHGGYSSDADWLTGLMRDVGSPWFGTLPDFGNFDDGTDRYAAVEKMMPFAKAVSAKTLKLDEKGDSVIDYPRMMKIVLDAGYRGWLGIECESASSAADEPHHVHLAKALLEKIRAAGPVLQPIWNGKDLKGWEKVAGGGEWAVEGGLLVARNGKDWSTDPSRTGTWLRTEKEHGDFELLVEWMAVKPRSNSGVFIRSALERNPAFTGYEVQVYDDATSPPRKGGPGSLYDVVAPAKNRIRPAGEWNEYRVIAKGQTIRVHENGEMVIDFRGDRATKGYIGLQNHDDKSEVRFRSVLLADL